jgi:glycosyltransferase involved in cell wall biosynthesis
MWENEFDALIVPMNDSKAMADAVIRILTEPSLAQKLSTNARKKAENYDWSVILPQWEALFEKVLNHG